MLIDWNGNDKIDPSDIAISLAMEEAGVFDDEEENDDDRDDMDEYQES